MPTLFSIFFQGFISSLGLIVAIGAQNAFVLKQGLKKEYVFWVCLLCALSDSVLIGVGVFGFGPIISNHETGLRIAQIVGALFLFLYGLQHVYQAFKSHKRIDLNGKSSANFLKITLICLAFTWLNPHVYLDTVLLIGAISTEFYAHKIEFAAGAMLASWFFFFCLGYAAQLLRPIFQSSKAWRILDTIIAMVMFWIAYRLVV